MGAVVIAIRRMRAEWIEARHSHVMFLLCARLPDVYPTQDQIADDGHMARSSVALTLAELRDHGLISYESGKGKRKAYRIRLAAVQRLDPTPGKVVRQEDNPDLVVRQADISVVRQADKVVRQADNAKGQSLSQLEAAPERARAALDARSGPGGRRPPLPSAPARHQPGQLQPLAPRRPTRTRQAP